MKITLVLVFLLMTGFFCLGQSYETASYNLNGTPNNGMKIKTNLPFAHASQMVTLKVEGYCYGRSATIGLNVVWYIYNNAFINCSASSWGAYTPDIFLSNENGLVCITLADKPYFPRFKVSAFAKGLPQEILANFQGWSVVDSVAGGSNITPVPYKNLIKNLSIGTSLAINTSPPSSQGTYNMLTLNPGTGAVEVISPTALNVAWTSVSSKPTSLAGYGITDTKRYYSNYGAGVDANRMDNSSLGAYQWLNTPVNGIGLLETNNTYQNNWTAQEFVSMASVPRKFIRNYYSGTTWSPWYEFWHSGNFNNLSQLTTRNFADLQNKPNTLAGYGITDAVRTTGNETISGTKFFNTSIGIGTTNMLSYKLAVGGGIIAESIKVKPQSAWADYVFEKDYPILSLKELEQFVLKNKHLPEIPTAAEVKKEGIDLGEMNINLLKKVEELTLYLIEKDKQIEVLTEKSKKADELYKKVEELIRKSAKVPLKTHVNQ